MQAPAEPDAWLWPGTRLRIARVLVDADTPLAGSDIAQVLVGHTSNVNRELGALEHARLVTVQPPDPADPPAPGRPSRYWHLDAEQRRIVEDVLATNPTPQRPDRHASNSMQTTEAQHQRRSEDDARTGQDASTIEIPSAFARLDGGHELVIADVSGSRVVDLMAVLAESQQRIRLTWTALCGDELMMAFDGPGAPSAALNLMSILRAGGSDRIRRATVSRVWLGDEFLAQARASTRGGHDESGAAEGESPAPVRKL